MSESRTRERVKFYVIHQELFIRQLKMSSQSRFFSDSSTEVNHETLDPVLNQPQQLFVDSDEDDEQDSMINESESAYLLFESDIQAIIPNICPSDVQRLHSKYNKSVNPVLEAVNDYYDGESVPVSIPKSSRIEPLPTPQSSVIRQTKLLQTSLITSPLSSDLKSSQPKRKRAKLSFTEKSLPQDIRWRRFIGSIQVVAWATRPTVRPIEYGTSLTLEKNAMVQTQKQSRNNTSVSSFVKLIQDNDKPSSRKEVGRMPEDITSILYPLLNEGICDFDVTVLFCDGRLSIGDSFIVQLDFYLTSKIFQNKNKTSNFENEYKQMKQGFNNSSTYETPEEMKERKIQIALVKLFNKLEFKVSTEVEEEIKEVIELGDDSDIDDDVRITQKSDPSIEHSDEMNLNQLKEFYKRTQTEKNLSSLPETETGDNFKLSLRSYQKQGLTWMLRSERELENKDEGDLINPLWKEFEWPKDRSWRVSRDKNYFNLDDDSKLFYANLYSGEFSLTKPILKSICRGGILADEMGLGKTVSTLSLIHNAPFDKEFNKEEAFRKSYAYNTTLIIVPTSLLAQWQDEFTKANNDDSKFLVYYGSEVGEDLRKILCTTDSPPLIVFTTYGTIQNEWSKSIKNENENDSSAGVGIFSVKYFRVVLDEGHNIRNRMNKTTKACYDISASRKWLLTGTPIINRLDDLYSLVKFLKLEPWSNISYWNTFVTTPFEKKNYKQALDVVQAILEPILLRRTKNMKKDGKPLVELPPKEVVIERIKFSPKEWKLYSWFLAQAENSVKAGIKRGDLLKNYTSILVHILRLRQLCDHMDLIKSGDDEMDEDINSKSFNSDLSKIPNELLISGVSFTTDELAASKNVILSRYPAFTDLECSICTTQPIPTENITFTECGHSFCLSCILEHCDYQELKSNPILCPNCRSFISTSKLLKPKLNIFADTKISGPSNYILQKFDNTLRSSKLNALLNHLRIIRDTTPNEKVVVFSQFSSYLDIMERELQLENGLRVFKFHGGLSMEKRTEILKKFKEPRQGITVLLLSLKAGGVGLNLTEASKAFMCDPWWSPGVEDQAIDRIHRIGQNNSVKVVRFIMEGSIEEKMLKIQERKRTIGEAVEAEEEERRKRRVEEIQMLFEST